jgi:hypothetical protein
LFIVVTATHANQSAANVIARLGDTRGDCIDTRGEILTTGGRIAAFLASMFLVSH